MKRWTPAPLALLSGALLGCAFAPVGWWPLAFVAVAALTLVTKDATPAQGWRRGWLFGLGLGLVGISWVSVLGWWVAAVLVCFMALWQSLVGWGSALLQSGGREGSRTAVWLRRCWPVTIACLWSLSEFGACRIPFGGFGWQRLAYTQANSPLAQSSAWFGVVGLGLVVALLGQLLALAVRVAGRARLVVLASAAVLAAASSLLPAQPLPITGDEVRIGMVQGDVSGTAGSHAMGYARSVTDNHVSETVELMTRARIGADPAPDFVLWPENSTDIDPSRDAETNGLIATASAVAGRPILVGAVTEGPGVDERQTTALWWSSEDMVEATYHKRNLVPFGEWIPLRQQLLPVLPILEQVGAQSVPGTVPGRLDVRLDDGSRLAIGDVVCFELAWDRTVREAMQGAEVAVVQSNNATYTGTGQPHQQFAITRLRAIESGREVVVATTSSLSGLVRPDGTAVGRTREATAAAQTFVVPRRSGRTPAQSVAGPLELGAAWLAALALVAAVATRARRR